MDRFRSPFAGAFILSWLIHNWQIFYSLFNFDPADLRVTKIKILTDYFESSGWCMLLWQPLIWAVVGYIFFNLFDLGFTFLSGIVNYKVKPNILKITSDKNTIDRKIYDDLASSHDSLSQALDSKNASLISIRSSLSSMESNYSKIEKKKNELESDEAHNREAIQFYSKIETDLSNIFRGTWVNHIKFNLKNNWWEWFYIDENRMVLTNSVDGVPSQKDFIIEDVIVNMHGNNGSVSFTKFRIADQKRYYVRLFKFGDDIYYGFEDDGNVYPVCYYRNDDKVRGNAMSIVSKIQNP